MTGVLSLEGTVAAVACDAGHRFNKRCRDTIELIADHGVEGDAHAAPYIRHRYLARSNPRAPNLRQLHLLPRELFDAMETRGFSVSPSDLGENITTAGLDLEAMPTGVLLSFGGCAVVELTGLRVNFCTDKDRAAIRGGARVAVSYTASCRAWSSVMAKAINWSSARSPSR